MSYVYKSYDLGVIFAGRPSGRTMLGIAPDCECSFIPTVPAGYVAPGGWFDASIIALRERMPLYLYGPTGTGKTLAVKVIAAMLRLPVYEVTGHNRLEFPELVGGYHVADGNMVWHDGPLTSAMRNGGIFLLNEQGLLDPSTATGLNSVLDGSPLFIPETGEAVTPHAAFHYVATDNSNGQGDETGEYAGVLRQNSALLNRFMLVEASYLPPTEECKIITNAVPATPPDVAEKMVVYAGAIRKAAAGKGNATMSCTMSVRDLCRWAKLAECYASLAARGVNVALHTLAFAFLNRLSHADRDTALQLYQRIFNVGVGEGD